MVELGRVDIAIEVSALQSFLAMPREGHMWAALNIMLCLKIKYNTCLVLDPRYAMIEYSEFKSNEDST